MQDLILQGRFRKDLYYRLNIISIEVPPLRDRKIDIPLLAEDFVRKHSKHLNKKIDGVSQEALELLVSYDWPGNIRELENVIERAMILSKGPQITPIDFPDFLRKQKINNTGLNKGAVSSLKDALCAPEKELIVKTLEAASGNRNEAAKLLGINRTTLYKKMHKFGLLNSRRRNAA